jgi:hypothetical protein
MMLADSPFTWIRCAKAAFEGSDAIGRPMDWPRARRVSPAAARRSRPDSNSGSAKLARTRRDRATQRVTAASTASWGKRIGADKR